MPLEYPPALPAKDIYVAMTFTAGTAEDRTMKIWLDGTCLHVPDSLAEACRAAPYWEQLYPDQQARFALKLLFEAGFPDDFREFSKPPPAPLFFTHPRPEHG